MGEVHDVAKLSNGDLVIATADGLYHTDDTGNTVTSFNVKATLQWHHPVLDDN